jgi:hypothetical protein
MPDPVKDETQQTVEGAAVAASDTDVKTDLDAEETKPDETGAEGKPTDVDGVAEAQRQFVENLLVTYDLETPEQLEEFIDGMADLKGKLAGEDIDDLLDNKALMQKYQKHWAAQDAVQKKDGETPEETIKRLEGEIADKDVDAAKQRSKAQQAKEAQRALTAFNSTVDRTIKGLKEVPSEYREFFGLFMGVNNPINDVDLGDKGSVIDLTKKGAKRLMAFEQTVIKRYLEGKAEVPKVTTTVDTATETEPKPIKNLGEARNAMVDKVKAIVAKKAADKAAAK